MRARAFVIAAGVVAAALPPAAASADQYVVDHCRHFAPDAPFIAFGDVTGSTITDCDGGTGGLNAMAPMGQMGAGTSLEIGLSIPADRPNIQIERVQTLYGADGPLSGQASLGFYAKQGTVSIRNDAAPVSVPGDVALAPGTRSLQWRLTCTPAACQFPDEFPLFVNKNRLYLNESVAPTLTVTGGTLVATGAKAGQQSFVFDATDTDSGVAGVTVSLDATVVGTAQLPCAFSDWSVCPRDVAGQSLQVDTTKVADGSHVLSVVARDGANNVLTRSLGAIIVANGPDPATAPNGTNASRTAKLSARFATTRRSSRRLRFGSRPTVRGTLLAGGGQPIGGATIAILARPRQAGARAVQVATAQTGADGGFSAKLPGGPSRTLTFAYTAFAGDAKPATTATLRTTVRALVSARVAPRAARPGGRIRLSGKLTLLPRKGVDVKIQALQGSTWRTIDDVRSTRTGSFRWRYRFAANQARRTYAFRARVASPIYPFAAGNSKPVRVRVR